MNYERFTLRKQMIFLRQFMYELIFLSLKIVIFINVGTFATKNISFYPPFNHF